MADEGHPEVREVYLKALAFAGRRLSRFESQKMDHLTAEDVTHTVIMKILSGERPWNKEKCPDFFAHVAGCIKSEISNTYTSSNNKSINRDKPVEEILSTHESDDNNPEKKLELEEKVSFLINYIARERNDLVETATTIYKEGIDKPQELAEILDLSVKEVNTNKFALKRIFKKSKILIDYISNNRHELLQVANAVIKENIEDDAILSKILNIDQLEASKLKKEVLSLARDIRKGIL